MTTALVYGVTGFMVFGLGLLGLLINRDLIRRAIAMNVMGCGVFLVLVALSDRDPAAPPDPVPHAMVITGIVVAVAATALVLALGASLRRDRPKRDPDES